MVELVDSNNNLVRELLVREILVVEVVTKPMLVQELAVAVVRTKQELVGLDNKLDLEGLGLLLLFLEHQFNTLVVAVALAVRFQVVELAVEEMAETNLLQLHKMALQVAEVAAVGAPPRPQPQVATVAAVL